jgi:hypothetical protein
MIQRYEEQRSYLDSTSLRRQIVASIAVTTCTNVMFALKGTQHISPGQRPGNKETLLMIARPERAKQKVKLEGNSQIVSPLQGFCMNPIRYPGLRE